MNGNEIPFGMRTPPHSRDAEMCLVGSYLLVGDRLEIVAAVNDIVCKDDFFSADNQIVFEAARKRYAAGKPVDATLVGADLESANLMDDIGGIAYLGQVLNTVPSYEHAEQYARVVADKSRLRNLIHACGESLRQCYAPQEIGHSQSIASELAARCAEISAKGKGNLVHQLADVAKEVAKNRNEKKDRIPTGLQELDNMIGGLPIGGHTIIAGKPGMAKSASLKQIAKNIAGRGIPVGIVSIEEVKEKIAQNALSGEARIENHKIAFGTATDEEWDRVAFAAEELEQYPISIVDSAYSLSQITAMVDLLVHKHKCKVIMIDHVHLIDGEPSKSDNRETEITKISASLKRQWQRTGVAGICAAQLNRASGRDRPTKDNLRGSGSLGQDGDVIIMLHREDYYRKADCTPENPYPVLDGVLEMIVDKNKSGPNGTASLRFIEEFQIVEDQSSNAMQGDDDYARRQYEENF